MSIYNNPNLIRQVILEYHEHPKNKSLSKEPGYLQIRMNSESCIDDIELQLKVENNIIEDVRFDGVGCAISTASTSIMTELLKGRTLEDAEDLIANFQNMLLEKEFDEDKLEAAVVFKNVSRQANRIKCATIGWNGVRELIEEYRKK